MCAELCLFSRSLKMQAAIQSAPRDKSLIFRPSADNSSRRRLRLLSCPRSVGSLPLAVPARSFAKLRSDKKPDQAPRQQIPAGSLQSICRIFGDRTCVTCRQIERSQTQELRRLCPLFANRMQERDKPDGSRCDMVTSGIVNSRYQSRHDNINAIDPKRSSDRCKKQRHTARSERTLARGRGPTATDAQQKD
jgi:hypothetical protein